MVRYHERGRHGRVVRELGLSIVSGQAPEGSTLDVDDLEHRFVVSRTVIREALKVLASKGLVDSRPRRGTFVRPRSEWNKLDPDVLGWRFEHSSEPALFDELHEVRCMIEPASARLAAQRRTPEDIEAAARALSRMQVAFDAEDPKEFVSSDVAFHAALLTASHNELVDSLATVIELGLEVRDRLVVAHTVPSARDVTDHRRVLDAVVSRDAGAAQRRMEQLLERAGTAVVRQTAAGGSRTRSGGADVEPGLPGHDGAGRHEQP